MMCTYFRAASLPRLPASTPFSLSLFGHIKQLCRRQTGQGTASAPSAAIARKLLPQFVVVVLFIYLRIRKSPASFCCLLSPPPLSLYFFFVCLAVFMLLFLSGGANGQSASAPAKGAAAASTRHHLPPLLPCQCFILSLSPTPFLSVCLAAFLFKHKFFIFLNQ